jgi:hypothetical protein
VRQETKLNIRAGWSCIVRAYRRAESGERKEGRKEGRKNSNRDRTKKQ